MTTNGVGGTTGTDRVYEAEDAGAASRASQEVQVPDLLPQPTTSVNLGSITSVILLMERSLSAQRKSAEGRRDAAEVSQQRQEKQVVEKMRDEADTMLAGAFTSGLISIAAGTLQLVSAGMNAQALEMQGTAAKVTEDATDALAKAEKSATEAAQKSLKAAAERTASHLKHSAQKLTTNAGIISAGGALIAGLGKGAEGVFQSSAKERQADQTEHNHAAQAASRDAKRADEMATEMGELRQKMIARLEQLVDSEQQGRLAIIQRA